MAEEEEPKKKSGIVTIVIFVVAGFILVAIGLGVGFLVFGGAQGNPQDIANEIVTKQNEAKGDVAGEGEGEGEAEVECDDEEKDEEGNCPGDPEKISKETPKDKVFQTLYYEIPGSLTTNLKGSRRFLQISVGLSTKYDETILTNVENHLPALKSVVLAALSDYTEEMVVGREARKLLAADIHSVMNEKLEELEGFGGIEEVMFTSYVMQ